MSWFFLRNGVTSTVALSTLDDLIQKAGSLDGSLNYEAKLAADQYLRWTEDAENRLSSLYEQQTVPRSLLTERYWRIRSINDETLRPQPLIKGELSDQKRFLESLRDQLQHYSDLVMPSDEERLVMLDTNVLLHGKRFHEVAWNDLFHERKIRLVMPLVVIDELDKRKDQGDRVAGAVLKAIRGILTPGDALERVKVRTNVTLQLTDEPSSYERLRSNDDELVRQVTYFSNLSAGKISIITIDRSMRVRAEAANIKAIDLPDEYLRKIESDDQDA